MQSLHPEMGQKNQFDTNLPIPGITLSESWRSAFGKLSAGCLSDARAVVVIGERGVGKVSLIDAWHDVSRSAFNVVTLKDTTGEPDQAVADLARQMGVDTADLGRGAIMAAIANAVKTARDGGRETVVIVPDADNIPSNTIELLMLLARDRSSPKPLLRYILSGSDKLRKTMRLDGGTARRQNYVTVEMKRFTRAQTKAFVAANLSRTSDITIADDAADYLHESTSGKPANILTVLDKVRQGRMADGETEITRAHVQSLVKAPRPIGPAPKKPVANDAPKMMERDSAKSSVAREKIAAVPDEKPVVPAEPGNVFATNADLPDSIRNVNDPRPLLRWAFGLDEHSETEALNNRAQAAVAARAEKPSSSGNPADLNEALAKVAAREKAERNPTEAVLRAPAPQGEGTLDHMIQGEAFSFEEAKTPISGPVKNPNELNTILREPVIPPTKRGRTNKVVLSAGVAVMGVAALGLLWTALQPGEGIDPVGGNASPQQTASVVSEPDVAPVGKTPDAADQIASTNATTALNGPEPDLARVIAQLKSPDALISGPPVNLETDWNDTPRIVNAGYLAPSGVNPASENFGLRQAILADMAEAERAGLVGEEERLLEQLAALEGQVSEKQSTLSTLEQTISEVSSKSERQGVLLEGRNAEFEVVSSRLAFIARDQAQADLRLKQATEEAISAEARLLDIRRELAASEALIAQNKALFNSNQSTAEELGEAVAGREAEFAELTQKVAEAETLLTERREELALVLAQQKEAQTALEDLESQLAASKASQAEIEADLSKLAADRDAQLSASEALNTEVADASARLADANAQLEAASTAFSERTAALAEIDAQTNSARTELDELVAQLNTRREVIAASNQELSALQADRQALEEELASKASQIEVANGKLEALEANQQTASSEFEALTSRREALLADVQSGEAVLENLTSELSTRRDSVQQLENDIANGAQQIETQQRELQALMSQSEEIVTETSNAQAAVAEEQNQVASATDALAALKAEQSAITASLTELEQRTSEASLELAAIQDQKSDAEAEISATVQRLEAIKAQEVAAEDGLSSFSAEFEEKQAQLQQLEGRITASNQELEAVASKKAALNSQLAELTNEGTAKLREQQALLDQIALQLEEKQAALASLTQELATKSAELPDTSGTQSASLEVATVPAIRVLPTRTQAELPAVIEADPAPSEGIALLPRDAELVRIALADAPGLGRAPQDKKDALQAALVRGECVTEALKATFGRVNPHTLVALLENMEMCGS